MWVKEVHQTTTAHPETIWERWVDVEKWPEQDEGMEAARLEGPLAIGTKIIMKPRGAKETSTVIRVLDRRNYIFTNETKLPFGFLRFEHEIIVKEPGKTEFFHRVSIKGPLTPLLRRIFADKMAAQLPSMLHRIAQLAEATDAEEAK